MFLFGNVFMEFVVDEWYFAFPLFIMTLCAATLAVWRIWLNFNAKTDLNLFMPRLQEVMAREGLEGGVALQPLGEPRGTARPWQIDGCGRGHGCLLSWCSLPLVCDRGGGVLT